MKIIEGIKNFFYKSKSEEDQLDYIHPIDLGENEYEINIPKLNKDLINKYDKNKKTILIMDDFDGMAQLIKDELISAECCQAEKNFNILLSSGLFAGFSIKNLLKNEPELIVDIAFLDITLGGIVNGEELDGIDIAILLKERNPKTLIKFVTGHTLNKHNPEIFKFISKFENTFNVKMDEIKEMSHTKDNNNAIIKVYKHIINKTSNRRELLEITLLEYKNNMEQYHDK